MWDVEQFFIVWDSPEHSRMSGTFDSSLLKLAAPAPPLPHFVETTKNHLHRFPELLLVRTAVLGFRGLPW